MQLVLKDAVGLGFSTKAKSFVISDGVKNIGFAAFYGCSNLRNISIP